MNFNINMNDLGFQLFAAEQNGWLDEEDEQNLTVKCDADEEDD